MPKLVAVVPVKRIEALVRRGTHYIAPGGLYLQVTRSGCRSWVYRYSDAGRRRDHGLGRYDSMTRDEAIEKVRLLGEQRKTGVDPIRAKREKIMARATQVLTFREAMLRFHAQQLAGWTPKYAESWLDEMNRHVTPALGDMPVAQIELTDVVRALEPTWNTKNETAVRNRGRIFQILNACIAAGQRPKHNPADGKLITTVLAKPARIKKQNGGAKHFEAIDYKDMPALMSALRVVTELRAVALEVLILTAARTSEVLGLNWSEIDFTCATWRLPAERMKNAQPHVVPLTDRVVQLLARLRIDHPEQCPFVTLSDESMLSLLKTITGQRGATCHGIRSTFATFMGETTELEAVAQRCLSHLPGSKVERAYRRGEELVKRRKCLTVWQAHCDGTPQAQVVSIGVDRAA